MNKKFIRRGIALLLAVLMVAETQVQVLADSVVPSEEWTSEAVYEETDHSTRYVNENLSAVKDQGELGLCWAFATIAACEAELIQNNGVDKSIDLSELLLGYNGFNRSEDPLGNFSAARNSQQFDVENDQDWANAGHIQQAAMNALAAWAGASLEEKAPYISTISAARAFFANKTEEEIRNLSYGNNAYVLENAYIIDGTDRAAVKEAVKSYGGVVVSICADEGNLTESLQYDDTHKSFYHFTKEKTDHEVVIVGWDDTFNDYDFTEWGDFIPQKPANPGAWLIKNSWGTEKGNSGYFWMSYEDASIGRYMFAYDMEPVGKYDNNYQYDDDITGVLVSGEETTATDLSDVTVKNKYTKIAANIFDVKANNAGYEILKAVSFISYAKNGNYKIRIYTNLTDPSRPDSGDLVDTITGSYTNPGYHTVKTNKSISLTEGAKFAVVVEVRDSDGKLLGISNSGGDNGVDATAKTGQSFYDMTDGEGYWFDMSSANQAVFQIKAFTKNADLQPVETIAISENDIYMSSWEKGRFLQVNITPDAAKNTKLIWSSSDEEVATVSSEGKISPTGEGDCVITATTPNGLTASCNVHVRKAPDEVSGVSMHRLGYLSWSKVNGADGYYILKSNSPTSGYEPVKKVSINELDTDMNKYYIEETGLEKGSCYYLRIVAYKLIDGHEYEGKAPTGQSIFWREKLDKPTNFIPSSVKRTSVTMTWDAVDGAAYYKVGYHNEDYSVNEVVTVTTNSCTITGLSPSTQYGFSVYAVAHEMNGQSASSFSVFKDVTTTGEASKVVYDTTKNGFVVETAKELLLAVEIATGGAESDDDLIVVDSQGTEYKGSLSSKVFLKNNINLEEEILDLTMGEVTIDLQGYTLSSNEHFIISINGANATIIGNNGLILENSTSGSGSIVYVESGKLTIENAEIKFNTLSLCKVIALLGGDTTLKSVKMTNSVGCLVHVDNTDEGAPTKLLMQNCNVISESSSPGKALVDIACGNVTIDGGTFEGHNTVINLAEAGELTIKGEATITSLQTSVSNVTHSKPAILAEGKININKGTITGEAAAVEIYSDANISGGKFHATGGEASNNVSAAVIIKQKHSEAARTVQISGGDFYGRVGKCSENDISYGIYNVSGDLRLSDIIATNHSFNNEAEVDGARGIKGYVYVYPDEDPVSRYVGVIYNLGKANADNSENPLSYALGSGMIELKAPVLEGACFRSWVIKEGGVDKDIDKLDRSNPDGPIILYASWLEFNYKISFNANGGLGTMSPISCELGVAYTLTANKFTRKGFDFAGWNTKADGSGKSFENGASVNNLAKEENENVVLYAQWTAKEIPIVYHLSGAINADGNPTKFTADNWGNALNLEAATVTDDRYEFKGWYTDANYRKTFTTIPNGKTDTLHLYAKVVARTYSIVFEANGGTGTMAEEIMTYNVPKALLANNFKREGYVFAGWKNEAGTAFYSNKENVIGIIGEANASDGKYHLIAQWKNTFGITYVGYEGSETLPQTYEYKTGISKDVLYSEAIKKQGYTFSGWYSDSKFKKKITTITNRQSGDITLYAKWTPISVTINFVANAPEGTKASGRMNKVTGKYGDTIKLKAVGYKIKGYTFVGWAGQFGFYNDKDEISISDYYDSISSNTMTLRAVWEVTDYSITYNCNLDGAAAPSTTSYTIYDSVTIPALTAPEGKEAYTFAGWYTDKNLTKTLSNSQIKKGTVGNIVLYAKWNREITIEYKVKNATAIIEAGYTIKGTMTDQTVKNGKVTALTANKYSITNASGKAAYKFMGWETSDGKLFSDKQKVVSLSPDSGKLTLYAVFKKEFTVNYFGWKTETYTYGTGIPALETPPAMDGYTFGGWYKDSKLKTKVTKIAANTGGDITLYPKWTGKKYTVIYSLNNPEGSKASGSMKASSLVYGKQNKLKKNTYKVVGYKFLGWTVEKNWDGDTEKLIANEKAVFGKTDLMNSFASSVTLYAQWEKEHYTVNYVLNNSTATNTAANMELAASGYYVDSDSYTLEEPVCLGYTFVGWYSDKSCKKKVTILTGGSTGNRTYYAKWKQNK